MIDLSKYLSELEAIKTEITPLAEPDPNKSHPRLVNVRMHRMVAIYEEAKSAIEAGSDSQSDKDAAIAQIVAKCRELTAIAPSKHSRPMPPPTTPQG